MIELVIPDICPSPNKMLRKHWAERKKIQDYWRRWVWTLCVQKRIKTHDPPPFVHVTIERHSARSLDPDNLVGSIKPLLDGLRNNGLMVDDSPRYLSLTVTQVKQLGMEPYTRVLIR